MEWQGRRDALESGWSLGVTALADVRTRGVPASVRASPRRPCLTRKQYPRLAVSRGRGCACSPACDTEIPGAPHGCFLASQPPPKPTRRRKSVWPATPHSRDLPHRRQLHALPHRNHGVSQTRHNFTRPLNCQICTYTTTAGPNRVAASTDLIFSELVSPSAGPRDHRRAVQAMQDSSPR